MYPEQNNPTPQQGENVYNPSMSTSGHFSAPAPFDSAPVPPVAPNPTPAAGTPISFTPPVAAAPEPTPVARPTYVPPAPKPPKKKSKAGLILIIIAIAVACSLVGGVTGAFIYAMVNPSEPAPTTQSPTPTVPGTPVTGNEGTVEPSGESITVQQGQHEDPVIDIETIDTSKLMTAAELYAYNVNSTVGITTSITTNFWGYQTTSAAAGSGFIYSKEGYILTNHHVIEDSDSITVAMYDGTTYDAQLIGYDVSNDIAVLKIDAPDLKPVILGDSNKLNVGDDVVAIGNPLGELTFSLTKGTVSALEREVTMENGITMNLIQTDCAINSGNSGGALFNMYGEVVGITNAKYSSSGSEASIDNIGFAIPISSVLNIVDSIITKGYISTPYIGVSVSDVSEESLSYGVPKGASIRGVSEDSPAEEAGLQVGDIITAVNGKTVESRDEFAEFISDSTVGTKLTLTVYRNGNTITIEVTIGEKIQTAIPEPEPEEDDNQQQSGGFPFWPFWG